MILFPSSLNSIPNADSRSNSPTVVALDHDHSNNLDLDHDHSFCSEGMVKTSAEITTMILDDEDGATRDSIMQLEETE